MKKILTLCFGMALFINSHAQRTAPVNTSEFIAECMKGGGNLPNKKIALWLPSDFWQILGGQMKLSPDFTNKLVEETKNYNIFFIVDYTMAGASYTFASEEEIRRMITLKDSTGKVYKLLNKEEILPFTQGMLDGMSPKLAEMFGPFGSGMWIVVFKADQDNNEPVFNIKKKNNFSLGWDDTSFKWKLPFASVLEPKHCPVDGEEMKGNWNFLPGARNCFEKLI